MAADIVLSDLTTGTLDGTGVFDKLMAAANLHIDDQYQKDRLKGVEYATVYLGVMENVIAQSVQFLLQEKMVEAQIDGVVQDNLIKAQQLLIAQQELAIKTYEITNLLPQQLAKGEEEIDLLQSQDADVLAKTTIAVTQSAKDLLLKDEQIAMSVAQQATEAKKTLDVAASTTLKGSQNSEVLSGTTRAGLESTASIAKIEEETDLLQSKDAEELAATIRKDNESTAKVNLTAYEKTALVAKIEDENGIVIGPDVASNVDSTSPETKHHWLVKKLQEDALIAEAQVALTEAQVIKMELDGKEVIGKLHQDYGILVKTSYWTDEAQTTQSAYSTTLPLVTTYGIAGYQLDPTSEAFTDPATDLAMTPTTRLQAAMLKAKVEADVGTKTADGYEADSYYKQFRSLQELLFSIANAGVVDVDSATAGELPTGIYSRIIDGMERAMNNQTKVWNADANAIGIDLDNNSTSSATTNAEFDPVS